VTVRTAGLSATRLSAAALGLIVGCASPAPHRDGGEPVTIEDLAALPAAVTPENARPVVRQCLLRHRRNASDIHRRFAYDFRDEGFVQLYHAPATDRGDPARAERVFVDYAAVDSADCGTFTDLHAFRETVRVTLRGRFRSWAGWVTPLRPPPAPGMEPETRERESLDLDFSASEADVAKRLVEALRLLRKRQPEK
jgi:hypothetical protein